MTHTPLSIVLVEDDPFLAEIYVLRLEREGFKVIHARSGEEGLKNVLETTPSLVLLDLVLPKMDGFSVLKAIKENAVTRAIPVVILTNLGEESDMEKGKKLGAADYVIKAHLTPSEVAKKVKQILNI